MTASQAFTPADRAARFAAVARLAAAPLAVAGLTAAAPTPQAHAATAAVAGNSYSSFDLDYGVYLDIDGDGQDDFYLYFDEGFGEDYGDQILITPAFVSVNTFNGPVELVTPNTIVAEVEGPSVSFGRLPASAFNNGLALSSFSTVTDAQVLEGLYDENGFPDPGLFLGNFKVAEFDAVIYDSLSYTELLQPGNDFRVVFDIPGGSPYVGTLDFVGNFDPITDELLSITIGNDSRFVLLPEPAAATALLALAGLTRRRRNP